MESLILPTRVNAKVWVFERVLIYYKLQGNRFGREEFEDICQSRVIGVEYLLQLKATLLT